MKWCYINEILLKKILSLDSMIWFYSLWSWNLHAQFFWLNTSNFSWQTKGFIMFIIMWCHLLCITVKMTCNFSCFQCSLQRRYAFWHHSEIRVLSKLCHCTKHQSEVRPSSPLLNPVITSFSPTRMIMKETMYHKRILEIF